MKKTLVSVVALGFFLLTLATAHASSYISTFDGAADYNLNWNLGNTGPITLSFSNISGTVDPNLPPPGTYNWSLSLTSFGVLLGDSEHRDPLNVDKFHKVGDLDFSAVPTGPIDIGTYAVPPLSAPGSANLGNVTIPFSIFGLSGSDSLSLGNLTVEWTMPNDDIIFTISADASDLNKLKGYLGNETEGLNYLALYEYEMGIRSGRVSASGSLTATAVPEPATMLLLGLGLIGLAGVRRKLRK